MQLSEALPLFLKSIWKNMISSIVWSTNSKPDDVDDDGVPGRSWERGLENHAGITGPAVTAAIEELRAKPEKANHYTKMILKKWIEEYPKRASKLGSLAFVAVVLFHWLIIICICVWIGIVYTSS